VVEARFRRKLVACGAVLVTVGGGTAAGASPSPWTPYKDDKGSVLKVSGGTNGKPLVLKFSLVESGWVGATRTGSVSGHTALSLRYSGAGAANSIELKVLYAPNAQGNAAIFGVIWHRASNTQGGWRTRTVPLARFACWVGTGCKAKEHVDAAKVRRVDVAVSNKPNHRDVPGRGSVRIANVTVVR
jgi:hypothetical protein